MKLKDYILITLIQFILIIGYHLVVSPRQQAIYYADWNGLQKKTIQKILEMNLDQAESETKLAIELNKIYSKIENKLPDNSLILDKKHIVWGTQDITGFLSE